MGNVSLEVMTLQAADFDPGCARAVLEDSFLAGVVVEDFLKLSENPSTSWAEASSALADKDRVDCGDFPALTRLLSSFSEAGLGFGGLQRVQTVRAAARQHFRADILVAENQTGVNMRAYLHLLGQCSFEMARGGPDIKTSRISPVELKRKPRSGAITIPKGSLLIYPGVLFGGRDITPTYYRRTLSSDEGVKFNNQKRIYGIQYAFD